MDNSDWLKVSIKMLSDLKNKFLQKIVFTLILFVVCNFSSTYFTQKAHVFMDLVFFGLFYLVISIMVNTATKDLKNENLH